MEVFTLHPELYLCLCPNIRIRLVPVQCKLCDKTIKLIHSFNLDFLQENYIVLYFSPEEEGFEKTSETLRRMIEEENKRTGQK